MYRLAVSPDKGDRQYSYIKEIRTLSWIYLSCLFAVILLMPLISPATQFGTPLSVLLRSWIGFGVLEIIILYLIRLHYQKRPSVELDHTQLESLPVSEGLRAECLNLLQYNKIQPVISRLMDHYQHANPAEPYYSLLLAFHRQYTVIHNKRNLWLITHEEAEVAESRLIHTLLNLLNKPSIRGN